MSDFVSAEYDQGGVRFTCQRPDIAPDDLWQTACQELRGRAVRRQLYQRLLKAMRWDIQHQTPYHAA